MSQDEKLIKRLLSKPKDFSYNELQKLLKKMGYIEQQLGKTSGSRVAFVHIAFLCELWIRYFRHPFILKYICKYFQLVINHGEILRIPQPV